MGFKSLLETQVQKAMDILGQTDGLAPEQSYISVNRGGTTYDPDTGMVTEASTQYDNIPMVLARYTSDEIDGSLIVVGDQKAIIAALDLPVTPDVDDKILMSDGRVFMVMKVGGVPGESTWILQVRETAP